jgi:transposase-like protein
MTKKKNVYTAHFKAEAIEMMKENGIEKTAEDLGVSRSSLINWSKKSVPKKTVDPKSLDDALKENKKLLKENQYLKKINEVLKKSTAIFSQDEFPPFK